MSFNIAALLAAFCYLGAPALDQPECYQAGGSCQGDLDSVLNGIESQNECLKNCRGRDKCEWYTHNSASRTCFLFRNCPDIDENCLNCLTGQKLCPYYPGPGEPNKLLVIGGDWGNNYYADMTEVFDLDDPTAKCKVVEFFPAHTESSTGALLYGSNMFTCGGFLEGIGYTDLCYNLGVEEPVANMQVQRHSAASLPIREEQLWVTGGTASDPSLQRLSTTEFVSPDGSSYFGPDLPYPMEKHCLVQLNVSTAMLIGGYDEDGGYLDAFYYDIISEIFTKGPDSVEHRENHACGAIRDKGDGSLIVVSVGGFDGAPHNSSSSELLFEGSGEWVVGPEIPNHPTDTIEGITAADGERFIVVGGYHWDGMGTQTWYSEMFELQCTNRVCEWTQMEQSLMLGRRNHVLMLIPDSLVYCEP